MKIILNLVSHWDHRICLGLVWAFCINVCSAWWSVTTRISLSPKSTSSHFLSASMTPRVSCSYVKYDRWASVNFLDMKPAGLIVLQSLPCPKYAPQPDGHASLTTQTGSGLVLSIGFRESFLLVIALIDSKHLSWRLHQANSSLSEHIPDKGVVNADTLGRNRDMYSMSPRKR